MTANAVSARIYPSGMLNTLSRNEVERLQTATQGDLAVLLRRCALAVLNSGTPSDDVEALLASFHDFSIDIHQVNRGLQLEVRNAPASAFVDGNIIVGVGELLSAVIRDLIYFDIEIRGNINFDLSESESITNAVFEILRNAEVIYPQVDPDLVVCWGGHSISRDEYEYTKDCGYHLGLRRLNICTGCGQGAMKGPMKGAMVAHVKQRIAPGRYVGITEPGIIAAEPPNPIVNQLVIMPDIEKRLEAFIRLGHGIVVFPGGVGTVEEILYLLGILLKPENSELPFPLVFTGPRESAAYFKQLDTFLRLVFGEEGSSRYRIIIDDPPRVAQEIAAGMQNVRAYRKEHKDAYYYNWQMQIDPVYQTPFLPTHENMAALKLHRDMPRHLFASDLRRAFSGIVAGNVKPLGISLIKKHGLYNIYGEREIMQSLDELLSGFVRDNRMRIPGGKQYEPCYRIIKQSAS